MANLYLPALQDRAYLDNVSRDELIQRYFHLGLKYGEIVALLLSQHGISICIRQLKRILQRLNLARRGRIIPEEIVIETIRTELSGSGSSAGYRAMWKRLNDDHRIPVSRETVRRLLRTLDPDGVDERSRNRLRRRTYRVQGPNQIWHIDGYDKLKPFGFCIHGCIDGYSRRIIWLEVGSTNNDPAVVARYYLNSVRQIAGTPRIIRGDGGSENFRVAAIQRFFRRDDTDSHSGIKSFLFGKSVSNQRIEAWWSMLRRSSTGWWMEYFKGMRDNGLYNDNDIIHVEALKFCYMELLRSEMKRIERLWNTHMIRPSRNQEVPSGRPDVLYLLPELQNATDRKIGVNEDEVSIAEEVCCQEDPRPDCLEDFKLLANIIMEEEGMEKPSCHREARELYLHLTQHILDLL